MEGAGRGLPAGQCACPGPGGMQGYPKEAAIRFRKVEPGWPSTEGDAVSSTPDRQDEIRPSAVGTCMPPSCTAVASTKLFWPELRPLEEDWAGKQSGGQCGPGRCGGDHTRVPVGNGPHPHYYYAIRDLKDWRNLS